MDQFGGLLLALEKASVEQSRQNSIIQTSYNYFSTVLRAVRSRFASIRIPVDLVSVVTDLLSLTKVSEHF